MVNINKKAGSKVIRQAAQELFRGKPITAGASRKDPMPNRFAYKPGLDGIRCVAVLLVMLGHGSYGLVNSAGFAGVNLFFVLSGYLITSLLQTEFRENNSVSLRKFYVRRLLRLAPPLLMGVALCYLLWPYTCEGNPHRPLAVLSALFYFANLVTGEALGTFVHFWSLSVEEHFYFIWPVLAAGYVFKKSLRFQISWVVACMVAVCVLRGIAYHFNFGSHTFHNVFAVYPYRFTFCRIDAIFMGALLVLATPRETLEKIKGFPQEWCLLLITTLLILLLFSELPGEAFFYYVGNTLANVVCAVIVLLVAQNPGIKVLSSRPFIWVGRRSYGIYVYHLPIFYYLEIFRIRHSLVNLVIVSFSRIALTMLIAGLSYHFVEHPILNYKKRYQVTTE